MDAKVIRNFKLRGAEKLLDQITLTNNLTNIFRKQNPDTHIYTCKNPRQARRIDGIYISQDLIPISETRYKPNYIGDHILYQELKRKETSKVGKRNLEKQQGYL